MLANVVTLLRELIAMPSMSLPLLAFDQANFDVINKLAQWGESLGFRCEIMHITHKKANLIATLGTGKGGLILSGHTDTVPYDAKKWSCDLFQHSRIYGAGAGVKFWAHPRRR